MFGRLLPLVLAALAIMAGLGGAEAKCVGIRSALPADDGALCGKSAVSVPEGKGRTFHVGPGRQLESIGLVPWSTLAAGDTVFIHHRETPYREKILISGRGTPQQWIRVLGVPGPNGELPVISGDGAVTSTNNRHRWTDPRIIQWLGVVQIAVNSSEGHGPSRLPPGYIEVANLRIQDGFSTYSFTAENGVNTPYSGFAACIYARSAQHLVIRNNVLTNCGQGFFNWTGEGARPDWWQALQINTVVSGNEFYNNGNPNSYGEHQIYTESDGVIIEFNRFGPQRPGAWGSQLKDRSAGTVIRYNTMVQALRGWDRDLVEPEEGWASLSQRASYKQAFIYGNLITVKGSASPNFIHWNEDHQAGRGRATIAGGKLFFYHNTIVITANLSDRNPYTLFNSTWGGYECPPSDLPGVIDVRNNIVAVIPPASNLRTQPVRWGYCGKERFELGVNWITGEPIHKGQVSGAQNLLPPSLGVPSFVAAEDFRLAPASPGTGSGGDLAPEVFLKGPNGDNVPSQRLKSPTEAAVREVIGRKSDLGAF